MIRELQRENVDRAEETRQGTGVLHGRYREERLNADTGERNRATARERGEGAAGC